MYDTEQTAHPLRVKVHPSLKRTVLELDFRPTTINSASPVTLPKQNKEYAMKPSLPQQHHTTLINNILVIGLTAAIGLAGCDQKGPAEKAGEKIDQAANNAKESIGNTTDQAKENLNEIKDTLDKKASNAEAYIDKTTDASKATLEKTGERIDNLNKTAQQNIADMKENAGKELDNAKAAVVNNAETSSAYVDDSVITLKVKAVIDNDPVLKALPLTITTVEGVVKVSGTVDSEQTSARVVDVITSQSNVKSVQNELLVNTNALVK